MLSLKDVFLINEAPSSKTHEEAAYEFLTYAKEHPRIKVVDILPEPKSFREEYYYISTGTKGVRYTIRTMREGGYSYHVGTLGGYKQSPDYIIDKALQLVGDRDFVYYAPLILRKASEASEDAYFKFGKHKGQRLIDVVDYDPEYMAWAYFEIKYNPDSFLHKKTYNTFRKSLEEIVENPEMNLMPLVRQRVEKAERRQKWTDEKEAREEKRKIDKQTERETSEYFGEPKQRVNLIVTYQGSGQWTAPSYSGYGEEIKYVHIFKTMEGNVAVWFTTNPLGEYVEGQWQKYEHGSKMSIKATIKGHGEKDGVKQTKLTRVKVLGTL